MIEHNISLFQPSAVGSVVELKSFLDQGIDPNQIDSTKQTPLMVTILKGHFEAMKLLLEKGADPNLANIHGQTPLFLAASEGREDMVIELLNHGANSNLSTRYGNTPLYISAVSSAYTITHVLLQQEEKHYNPASPYFVILKRLKSHATELIEQTIRYRQQPATIEEACHDKIEFLILLMELLKQRALNNEALLAAAFNLEKRFQNKIFSKVSHTQRLFTATLRCIYTGSTYAFESVD